jgi:hypothetical protein
MSYAKRNARLNAEDVAVTDDSTSSGKGGTRYMKKFEGKKNNTKAERREWTPRSAYNARWPGEVPAEMKDSVMALFNSIERLDAEVGRETCVTMLGHVSKQVFDRRDQLNADLKKDAEALLVKEKPKVKRSASFGTQAKAPSPSSALLMFKQQQFQQSQTVVRKIAPPRDYEAGVSFHDYEEDEPSPPEDTQLSGSLTTSVVNTMANPKLWSMEESTQDAEDDSDGFAEHLEAMTKGREPTKEEYVKHIHDLSNGKSAGANRMTRFTPKAGPPQTRMEMDLLSLRSTRRQR